MASERRRVCIVGSGVAGLLNIKYCKAEGLEPVCFEQHDKMGGTWYYTDEVRPNQTASVYWYMTSNDQKDHMAFSDYPVPEDYPQYYDIHRYYEYLSSYVKHFDLQKHIRFNHTVTKVTPADTYSTTGQWKVSTKTTDGKEEEHIFDAVCICSGTHSKGRIPDLPGLNEYKGEWIHTSHYRRPEAFQDKSVVVVGNEFSAADIACDVTRCAKQVYLSMSHGSCVVPRTIAGRPLTCNSQRRQLLRGQEFIGQGLKQLARSHLIHEDWGIPDGGNPVLDGNWMITDELNYFLQSGKIKIAPQLARATHDSVEYVDGTTQKVDVIIFATGYVTNLEYVDCPDVEGTDRVEYKLYKFIFPLSMQHPTLAFIIPKLFGSYTYVAEQAARWISLVFSGKCHLPAKQKMEKHFNKQFRFFQEKCRGRVLISEFLWAEEIVAEFGARPDLYRLIFWSPSLAYKVYCGPVISAHYRLVGPGADDAAPGYCHRYYDKLFPNDIANKMKSFMWHTFIGIGLAVAAFQVKANWAQLTG